MKRSNVLSWLAIALLFGGSLFQAGCLIVAAGAASAGAVAYVRGELSATLASPLEKVDPASNQAIQQLQLVKVNEKKDAFTAIITARTADDKKVEINLTQVTAGTTKVQIRIGTFGDEAKSLAILDKIKGNL